MRIIPGNAQHIGAREEQQDAFGFSNWDYAEVVGERGVLAVLADGMGGMALGGEASQTAVSTMLMEYQSTAHRGPVMELLRRSLHQANSMVNQMAVEQGLENQVGTTLVATVIHERHLFWVSAGDSRIYLYRQHQLILLTEDHVYARRLDYEVSQGRLSKEEADNHPHRPALTSYLGLREIPEVDANVKPLPLYPGDKIILCSDGLHGVLTEQEMIESLIHDAQTASDVMLEKVLAKKRRYQDNVTVAILACEEMENRSESASGKATYVKTSYMQRSQKSDTTMGRSGTIGYEALGQYDDLSQTRGSEKETRLMKKTWSTGKEPSLKELEGSKESAGSTQSKGIKLNGPARFFWIFLLTFLAVIAVGGGYVAYQKWFKASLTVISVHPDSSSERSTQLENQPPILTPNKGGGSP